MDFYEICVKKRKDPRSEFNYVIEPVFNYQHTSNIIAKGSSFYAYWDGHEWITEKYGRSGSLFDIIDTKMNEERDKLLKKDPEARIKMCYINVFNTSMSTKFEQYIRQFEDTNVQFNTKILFKSSPVRREDYSTAQLEYDPKEGSTENFDILIDRLYEPKEKEKIMWFMGALLTGSMPSIQKFMFLYGGKGTGKGTVLKIFKKVFKNYYASTSLHQLTSNSDFATNQVREVPLLIDEDADLSKITNDTNLLKLTAHEPIMVNEKYKTPYTITFNGLLIAASNQRYKVRNIDSGITRRAVVVEPTNKTWPKKKYDELMKKIDFEIPAIAQKAIDVFKGDGSDHYENYVDYDMVEATDVIFSFVREYYDKLSDVMTLKEIDAMYLEYLEDLDYDTKGHKRKIKSEMQRYYRKFYDQKKVDGQTFKNLFVGLRTELIFPNNDAPKKDDQPEEDSWIHLEEQESKFDILARENNYPAQYTTDRGTPRVSWANCKTTLNDIFTGMLHFVRVPVNHIVIDFDLKDISGKKSLDLNIKAASKFPKTYCEVSKSGSGLHLHYIYDGDATQLSSIYSEGIEVKVFTGKSSLRRKLTLCNDLDIAHISTGLPLKERSDSVLSDISNRIYNEKALRTLIERSLRKEYNGYTKPSVDFIVSVINAANKQGLKYDLTTLKEPCLIFASHSSHNAAYCENALKNVVWKTIEDEDDEGKDDNSVVDFDFRGSDGESLDEWVQLAKITKGKSQSVYPDEDLWFFDIEVFPNMNLVVAKQYGSNNYIYKFNPDSKWVMDLMEKPLVGFNNRLYDNHILYAIFLGKTPKEVYEVSKRLIEGEPDAKYMQAMNISYADIYEYSSTKQSLKKWEIEMGTVAHDELEFDFNDPLPEEYWDRCLEYCEHDVAATEELFKYRHTDYEVRKMLADVAGVPINTKTNSISAQMIFGSDKSPQKEFVYTKLNSVFPGYEHDPKGIPAERYTNGPKVTGKSLYMGEDPSEGGYVYASTGVYGRAKTFDIASMHPSSIIALNLFGDRYTKRFAELVQARIAIKHGDYDTAGKLFDGKLKKYLTDKSKAKLIAKALKIVINSVYGLTSANYPNRFKDPRNVDNIVAKRGALFMITLKNEVIKRGYHVIHCKTDSIKIENPDEEIENFVNEFGLKYGYKFEVEDSWKRLALVNKSTLIGQREDGSWSAVGAEFQMPYVYKTLFSHEQIDSNDLMITKQVKSKMYVGDLPEKEKKEKSSDYRDRLTKFVQEGNCDFIGRIARIYASLSGTDIIRFDGKGVAYVTGTKGHKWKIENQYKDLSDVDMNYYHGLVRDAVLDIAKVGPVSGVIDNIPRYCQDLEIEF